MFFEGCDEGCVRMNYYRRYMGDYARDTAHLSLLEHGAYCLLLDYCYSNDTPTLPPLPQLYRICRAITPDEQAAVDAVVAQYWPNKHLGEDIPKALEAIDQMRQAGRRGVAIREAMKGTHKGRDKGSGRSSNHQPPDPEVDPNDGSTREPASRIPACPFDEIRSLYLEILPQLSRPTEVARWPEQRRKYVQARWREYPDLEEWRQFFGIVSDSPFLTGKVNGFKATFDWLIRPTNFQKVIEHNYEQDRESRARV